MWQVVALGHPTVDIFLKLDPKTVKVSWSKKERDSFLLLDFDDKTPVEEIHFSPGGGAVNTAVGLQRLKISNALIAEAGADLWGHLLKKKLAAENLALDWFSLRPQQRTDLSVILLWRGQRTILSYHFPRHYQLPQPFPPTEWLYLSSLGPHFASFHRQLAPLLQEKSIKLIYNPGSYELSGGFLAQKEILDQTKVLIVNREEGGELVGEKPLKVEQKLLIQLRQKGPEIVVVTDGDKGSFAFDGRHFYQQEIIPSPRREMTGAGDAFSAGFIAALIKGHSLSEALLWGNLNSAAVIGQYGSTAGLLTLEKLQKERALLSR